jgi:hypothetical protein
MVNENHFRFDRKTFFNFWKTIYGFKFFEIKFFVLACTFDIRKWLLVGIQAAPESGNIQPPKNCRIWMDPAGSGQNGRDPEESGNFGRIRPNVFAGIRQHRPNVAGFRRQLHFLLFVIFSCEPNARKYFRENYYF